jgi:hypothetical protein
MTNVGLVDCDELFIKFMKSCKVIIPLSIYIVGYLKCRKLV